MNETTSDPSKLTNSSHSDGPPNSSTAIAAGVVVPFIVGSCVFVFSPACDDDRRDSSRSAGY
ncbi:hypothetical protein GGS24DRAFT_483987, partial [Hypoxylon argillaceum]